MPDAQNPQGETRGKSLADKFFDAQSAKKPVVKKVAKEGTVIFRGEQIKVNQDYLPIDEKGLESVKTKLFWLIELNPGDLPEYIRVLSLDELRVFNSVISTLISNHSNPILEKSDVRRMLRERFEALQGNEPTIPFEK